MPIRTISAVIGHHLIARRVNHKSSERFDMAESPTNP
jgi:hypothetical protein